jgi:hypothetical protein
MSRLPKRSSGAPTLRARSNVRHTALETAARSAERAKKFARRMRGTGDDERRSRINIRARLAILTTLTCAALPLNFSLDVVPALLGAC